MSNIKNELPLEKETKKKLYKSWKPYASVLAIIVIGASIAIGIYTVKNHNRNTPPDTTIPITPINLSELDQTMIPGIENMTEQNAFNAFIANNQEKYPDLESNAEISLFAMPTYTIKGKLVVKAKTNSTKYTGNITVPIKAIEQIALNTLSLNLSLTTSYTNENDAFDAFINLNSQVSDLRNNVEITNFVAPEEITNGKLTINAKVNSKYYGNVEVIIQKLEPLTVRDKILQKIKQAQENNDSYDWGQGWLEYQSFLENDIESHSFTLTQEQLTNNSILKDILKEQFFADVKTDLKKWKLPQDFIENFVINTFDIKDITDTTISFFFNVATTISTFTSTEKISLISFGDYSVSYQRR